MNITLYKNISETNKLNKTLQSAKSFSGNLREECNVMNPSILLQAENITQYNYAKISEFNRSYFIDSIESVRNGLWRVNLSVDVLDSYKDQIKNIVGIIEKTEQENQAEKMLNDGSYMTTPEKFTQIIEFPIEVKGDSNGYLLTCL